MNYLQKFEFKSLDADKSNALDFYRTFGYVIIENVFKKKHCVEMKKRAFSLVKKDQSSKTVGFSLKKNKHHSSDNFLSSAYKINNFYEDKMINTDGTFKDKKINCISKLGHCLHDIDLVFKKYSYHDRIKKIIKLTNLSKPILNQSSYIFKQPLVGGEYLWHQDSTYLFTKPLSCLALWIAIDDANEKNGCLIVKPFSHKEKIRKRVKYIKGKVIKQNLINKEWDENNNIPLSVKTGSIIIFDGSLAHKSSENFSKHSRNTYVMHFFDNNCKYSKENWLQRPLNFPFKNFYETFN